MKKNFTYLALGDSYTIGESVPANENFPNTLVSLLRTRGAAVADAEIIARTGWTTDELKDGIAKTTLHVPYDLVTLLIGVNNQYRGRSLSEYQQEFAELLNDAVHYAGDRSTRVMVVSIPDWGVTPYAEGRNRKQIAAEIDAYNLAAMKICAVKQVKFIEITESTRAAAQDRSLLADDGLHPSGKEYLKWAEKIAEKVEGL